MQEEYNGGMHIMMEKLSLDKFEEAYERVQEVVLPTNLVQSDFFSQMTGNKVYFKPENLQLTGAYKIRGAYYKISTLSDEEKAKGLITASAGNHAQGVAYAARKFGAPAIVVMPTTTPLLKVNRTKELGAEVVLHGNVYDEACEKAKELAAEHGYTFVHPFDDLEVATGQGSIAMEIVKELPTVDMILVPVGGGGLSTGVSTLAKMLNPKIKVIGVEPAGANCLQESLKAGHPVTLKGVNTIADGTAVKTPGETIFPYLQENLDDIITIEDDELIVAFLDILSGGNMDIITLASVVQNGLIQRSRIFTVSVLLPDVPGQLNKVSKVIADVQGNVIKLEHNQFVSVNRNSSVELTITMEAFGHDHKKKIIDALRAAGFKPKERTTRGVYQ